MFVKFNKLNDLAITPNYANPGDAGLDLYSVEEKEIPVHGYKLIKTGISLELPEGFEAQIRSRSGLALKHGITVLNSPGTIDTGYRGEIGVILMNHGLNSFRVLQGMKIAQMVIARFETVQLLEADELSLSVRGVGGFGSTGL